MSDARRAGHRGTLITADACVRLGPQVKYEMTEEVISCFAPDCLLQCERVKGVMGGRGRPDPSLHVIMQMDWNTKKDRGLV